MHKLALALVLAAAAWAALAQERPGAIGPGEPFHAGHCPLGHGPGIPVPEREQLGHCECEKWWRGSPARLAFRDCSDRKCQENGVSDDAMVHVQADERDIGQLVPRDPWIYLDLQLYRCPRCGLIFTDPETP